MSNLWQSVCVFHAQDQNTDEADFSYHVGTHGGWGYDNQGYTWHEGKKG